MNTAYLANLIAEKLHTLVCCYDLQKKLEYSVNRLYDVKEYASYVRQMEDFLLDLSETPHNFPLLSSVDKRMVFCTIPTPENIYLIGPVRFFVTIDIRHNINLHRELDPKATAIPRLEIPEYLLWILLFRNLFFEETISDSDFLTYNCNNTVTYDIGKSYYNTVFQRQENNTKHNSYEQEERMLESIETGNLELLQMTREESQDGEFGIMASNAERSYKNICISAITLASRAAIRGGVHPELAFSLCDSYVLSVERVVNLMELQPIVEGAKTKFAEMVREIKARQQLPSETSYHPLVNKCKDYIYNHLHDKIILGDIAAMLGTNANYLSVLFRKCENISFSDFVLREKIELAKTMLIYSSFSYAEIAAQLAFASQSHFGKHFLALTGMTPKQYRSRFNAQEGH